MSINTNRDIARAKALAALAAMTDEEDAAITAAAESDPDAPPLSASARLRPADPELLAMVRRARGQRGPGRKPAKVQVALRLDADVVARWRATGRGWQTRMGEALKRALGG